MPCDTFLLSISDGIPSGEDLSFSIEFDTITELRREDDPTLAQGAWVTALKTADWPAVQARCSELLTTRSKDLRLASWLTEAKMINEGYAGLYQGLDLCHQLSERFWDSLHPQPDEDGDMAERVGTVQWLLQRLTALARTIPIVRSRQGASYSLQQLDSARTLQATLERSPDKATSPPPDTLTLEKFLQALQETPKPSLRQSLSALEACSTALAAWQTLIDEKLGAAGPGFTSAREALASAYDDLHRLAREAGALELEDPPPTASQPPQAVPAPSPQDPMDAKTTPAAPAPSAAAVAPGPLRSRDQALAQLREVAAFFRATEPHSPVTYLADKALQWAGMPLHLWLRSVVKDAGTLAQLEEALGVALGNEAPPGAGR